MRRSDIDKVKIIKLLFIFVFTLLLCACTSANLPGSETVENGQVGITNHDSDSTSATDPCDKIPQSSDSTFVYIPKEHAAPEPLDSYVFQRWTTDGENGTVVGQYQDVSDLDNVIAFDSVYAAKGETIAAALKICGNVELCAFDLKISFDKNRLKYLGFENADDDLMVYCNEDNGTIMINFVRIVNLEEGFKFCDLLFEIISSEVCDSVLHITVKEAVAVDAAGEIHFRDVSTVHGTVHLNH